jgi:hypothetical protein
MAEKASCGLTHVNVPRDASPVWDAVAGSTDEDYDGHTEFERLSPSARLAWLEGALKFIEVVRQCRTRS